MSVYFIGGIKLAPDGLNRLQIPIEEGHTREKALLSCMLFAVLGATGCNGEMDESSSMGSEYDQATNRWIVVGELKSGGFIKTELDCATNVLMASFVGIPSYSPITSANLKHALVEAGEVFDSWGCFADGNQWTSRYA